MADCGGCVCDLMCEVRRRYIEMLAGATRGMIDDIAYYTGSRAAAAERTYDRYSAIGIAAHAYGTVVVPKRATAMVQKVFDSVEREFDQDCAGEHACAPADPAPACECGAAA